ncbi:cell division cycle and apoptosis regulator protein 1-like [Toxorhynchites rutilus septentrionalis]|uniref:cell division cycle and apoptosis regulator protein 1-like n=1 Tax=Toxorhynchites rutilus septentrionalis TaxID=329112 RepID=UPI0024789A78|nr:cell division cycle and apoptosis regulator protein 1-like [Toxorhynchites rutilus septentrionalis]
MAFSQKNPPWQRNTGQNIAGMQAIVSFQQAQPVFNQNLALQQQQNLQLMPQMGLSQQSIYSQTVQYPTSRPMNTIAFQNQPQAQTSPQVNQTTSKFNPNQRVFSGTGHITKVQNEFGFIDEEVFFHKNVCKGAFPKVGDRVLVEAAYNQNMPFKWNATRVQVLQAASSSSSINQPRHVSNYSSSGDRSGRNRYSPRKSPERHGHRSTNHDSRQRDVDDDDRRRRRDDRDNDRYRDKRDRTPERDRKDRERSPIRKISPKRRKVRPIPRYMVQMPKQLLTLKTVDILELRRRYHTLYVPSDFFTSEIHWAESFPPNEPFSIKKPCAFHVMHKDVEPLQSTDNNLEPPDADYLYSAKVMLMSTPPMAEIYQKSFATTEERDRCEDERDFMHPTRLINFLVGIRGKNETMAIGGAWSPSLDGENPHSNPNVLIKTAIRTCKGLTGIDLSNCTRWYRFVELYYRRSETYHKGRLIPARVETVVIFLPDVRSCQPTPVEWDEQRLSYKSRLERIVNNQNSDSATNSTAAGGESSTSQIPAEGATIGSSSEADTVSSDRVAASSTNEVDSEPAAKDKDTPNDQPSSSECADIKLAAEDNQKESADETNVNADTKDNSTNATTKVDLKKMKVADLKIELEARNLSTDGIKNTLVARLSKALKQEESAESNKDAAENEPIEQETQIEGKSGKVEKEEEEFETMDNIDMSEVTVIDEYDSTKVEEKSNDESSKKPEPVKLRMKERQLLERRYSLPEQPHIIVHPSRTAKSGKFDCAVMSLSVLLDYRPEDTKEHSFEVSLFAELFNEMLTRDFGFNIYKALYLLPAKNEDDPKKETNKEGVKEGEVKKTVNDGKTEDTDVEPKKDENDDKDKERSKERDRDSRKRSRMDDTSDEDRRRREKEKEREQVYTADRELLLSFTYFDVSHCGYVFDKDIEDLLYTLGLNLSRSQIRKLMSKAITRDALYYRKLTDKPKNTVEDKEELATDETVSDTKQTDDKASINEDKHNNEIISEDELNNIVIGNNNYMQQLKANLELILNTSDDGEPDSKRIKMESASKNDEDVPHTCGGLVVHNGGVLDIPKMLEQIKRSEKIREDTELLLIDLRRQNADLLKNNNRANDKIKDQSADLKSLSRKLIDAEHNLRELTKKANEYFSTLSSVYDRVSVVMNRSEGKRSSSISSSKRESVREHSNRKDARSKDKEAESAKDNTEKNKADKKSGESSDVDVAKTNSETKMMESHDANKPEDTDANKKSPGKDVPEKGQPSNEKPIDSTITNEEK